MAAEQTAITSGLPVSGRTRVVGVFGWPVAHSLSPSMHNAAFRHLGLDFIYVAFPVAPAHLPEALRGIRALDLVGVNLTIPHKEAALPHLDTLAPEVELIGAANTVHHEDGCLVGYNTDARGFTAALQEARFTAAGARGVLVGAGGAARAALWELARGGARAITLLNRTPSRAQALAEAVARQFPGVAVEVRPLRGPGRAQALAGADLLVNATPAGMAHEPPLDLPLEALPDSCLVCDLVYTPPETPLLRAARDRGLRTCDGLGMLVHQGALSFGIWTKQPAPVPVMRRALLETLAGTATGLRLTASRHLGDN
ncbi:MAG: shikimate dehydrogenase [Deltaproteobacteria bacterium]|nr:shikimate dehydrogenase [Deltaproteobacteria bacterium]